MPKNTYTPKSQETITLPEGVQYVERSESIEDVSIYPYLYTFITESAIQQLPKVVDELDRIINHVTAKSPEDKRLYMHFFPWLRTSKQEFIAKAQSELRNMKRLMEKDVARMPSKELLHPRVIVTNSHANDADILIAKATESGTSPQRTAVVVFDRHVDTMGNNGLFIPENRACAVANMIEQGLGKVSIVGIDYREVDIDSRLKKYPKSRFEGIPINSPQKPLQHYLDEMIEQYAAQQITNVVFSIDLDVLNLWRERISATMYSPYDALGTLTLLDYKKIHDRIANPPSGSSFQEECQVLSDFIGIFSGESGYETFLTLVSLSREEYHQAIDALRDSGHIGPTPATFSGLETNELMRSIAFIKRKCAEKGIAVGFAYPDGTQFAGTITEFYPDAPDINGNTAKVIGKISQIL